MTEYFLLQLEPVMNEPRRPASTHEPVDPNIMDYISSEESSVDQVKVTNGAATFDTSSILSQDAMKTHITDTPNEF